MADAPKIDQISPKMGPGGGKVEQTPQQSNKGNPMGDVGQKVGQQTNVEVIENVRKIVIRIQRLMKKDPTGKMATKQIRDAIKKLEKILKSK